MKMAAICLSFALAMLFGDDGSVAASVADDLVAIDVLLLPDAAMSGRVRELNQVLQNSGAGFAFDATHVPHLTLLQCYVRRPDLPAIEAAVGTVFRRVPPAGLDLTAIGFFGSPIGDLSAAGISVAVNPTLTRLHLDIVAAVMPFIRHGGTAAAFVDAPKSKTIGSAANYVDRFMAAASGTNFRPHVTVGLDHAEIVRRLVSGPFSPFAFEIEGAAIYQLGDIGTARKQLWTWRP
jgi:2'-5' RNA ligase superfamily